MKKRSDGPYPKGWGGRGTEKRQRNRLPVPQPPDPSHVDRIADDIRRWQEEGDPGAGTATYATTKFTSLSQSAKGKQRKGTRYPFNRMPDQLYEVEGITELEDVLLQLEDTEAMKDRYHSETSAIDVHHIEVDRRGKCVH